MAYQMTNQTQVRDSFWDAYPHFRRKGNQRQNDYPADIRVAFVDGVDCLNRNGDISDALANRVTL